MKHVFIINPTAGSTNAALTLVPKIEAAAKKLGVEYCIEQTRYSKHATELAASYAQQEDSVRLYACGGDGTLNEVLSGGYCYPGCEVAHIPCGSGNDMIRNFGKAADFLDIESQIRGSAKVIDLIEANGCVAASICAAGLDAKVAYNIPKLRRIPLCGGSAAYNLAVLKCIIEPLSYHWVIEANGQTWESDCTLTAVGNGSYYGGGYNSLPGAKVDDGLLNVILVKKMPRLRMVKILSRYKAGTHFKNGELAEDVRDVMESFATKEITIHGKKHFAYTIDGECSRVKDLHIIILPNAARFVLPEKLVEKNS